MQKYISLIKHIVPSSPNYRRVRSNINTVVVSAQASIFMASAWRANAWSRLGRQLPLLPSIILRSALGGIQGASRLMPCGTSTYAIGAVRGQLPPCCTTFTSAQTTCTLMELTA